ncbi:MAG: hypothetical protein B6V02_03405 [Thermoprotei archaeon ex4572_64]|nr:MAG: hypothetical protein B6V02_03405 [Thermoprotei archaeon ex4572_64]
MSTELGKRLRKAEKELSKMLKDLERGKYEKYRFRNLEEAKAFKEYIKEKLELIRKALESGKF